jgi:hypothetical protein
VVPALNVRLLANAAQAYRLSLTLM